MASAASSATPPRRSSPVSTLDSKKLREKSHKAIFSLRKPSQQQLSPDDARTKAFEEPRRDSELAASSSTTRGSHTTLETDIESSSSLRDSPSVPSFTFDDIHPQITPTKTKRWRGPKDRVLSRQHDTPPVPQMPFLGITTEIPTSSLEDLTNPGQIEFSNRGSMLLGGKKMNNANGNPASTSRPVGSRRKPSSTDMLAPMSVPTRTLSADDEMLSHKVRTMYNGDSDGKSDTILGANANMSDAPDPNGSSGHFHTPPTKPAQDTHKPRTQYGNYLGSVRETNELAGGIEDWENVHGGDVDRYGFIVPRRLPSQRSSARSARGSPEPHGIQRVSTSLQIASEAPRRQRSRLSRTPTSKSPARSTTASSTIRPESRTDRPASSQSSYRARSSNTALKIRSATNRLPQNKDRRFVDEAGDMLTLPPGLADISENDEDSKAAENLKKKEWEREEKWRKMAKVMKNSRNGGGMTFEFDTKSTKLIERTWKGIPDRWRATAWHAFLSASAKKRRASRTDDELITIFKELNDRGSPDDVQIDIDVPRTINSHIMFRRRYRGGQRLLFRVLHCLSIYFPETGYVQGMAALAATLLCYFDEEMAFVMMVRLWQLRGLERLYRSGFEGLMQALAEFEKSWLAGGEVSAKLTELGIAPTAYGTRWYLTLFNYSIPFPAQLRVWDVFMLLGDPDLDPLAPAPSSNGIEPSYHGGLDVLHATSAALIDGTREILLDSDFENAMKVLTSWIPIKDEELLMRVAKAEWKVHRRKG
ncbi:MAG: hypothetical protein Q9195_001870 [Heterodermia aff. obscurata]